MATFADDIYLTVLRAKCTSGCWAKQLSDRADNGDNIECDEKKFMLLIQWIIIMEEYYCQNFNNGSIIALPPITCLAADEAQELLSKIKVLIAD